MSCLLLTKSNLNLIAKMLRSGTMSHGMVSPTEEGTIQGNMKSRVRTRTHSSVGSRHREVPLTRRAPGMARSDMAGAKPVTAKISGNPGYRVTNAPWPRSSLPATWERIEAKPVIEEVLVYAANNWEAKADQEVTWR